MNNGNGGRGGSGGRILSVCFAVALAIAPRIARAAGDLSNAVAAPCSQATEITRLAPTDEGAVVETTSPASPRIELDRNPEQAFGGYSEIRVDIPNASTKIPLIATFERGPFIAVRGTRYRTATECGIRLRFTSKIVANWRTELVEGGFVVTAVVAESSRNAEAAMLGGAPGDRNGGAIGYRLSHSISATAGDTQNFDTAQIGFVQQLRARGTLRGFFSDFRPRNFTDAPYAALGIADSPIGKAHVDAAAGDLSAVWGTTGIATSSAINTLIFRGAGANVLLPQNFSLLGWHGRAAASLFSQLRTGEIVTDLSRDQITGVESAWADPLDRFGFGLGWARSGYHDGGSQDNFVQSFEERWNGGSSSIRSTLEESRGETGNGAAFTLEPRINMPKLGVNGFLRYFSRNFRPPLGSNYFATLRRSYGLSAVYQPSSKLTLSTNLSQSKTFQLFDPENAGTLSESKSVSANYFLTRRSGASVFYSESNLKSDPGALIQANSHSRSAGVAAFASWRRISADIRVSRDESDNRLEHRIDLRETVVESDLSYAGELTDVYGHVRVAAVGKSGINPEGYRDLSSTIAADHQLSNRLAVHAEAGHSERPPGTTLLGFREDHVSIGVRTGSRYSPFNGSLQIGYSRASSGAGPPRTGWIVNAGVGDLIQWGRDRARPVPPFDSRAMNIQQTERRAHVATLAIDVFIDANQNGVHDPGEAGVPHAGLEVDTLPVHTGRSGVAGLLLQPGDHTVQIEPSGAMLDYYIENERVSVTMRDDERRDVAFALKPAGRVEGRVVLSGELTDPALLNSIRINLKNGSTTLSAITQGNGQFTIGLVPAGTYTASIDTETISPETAVEGATEITIDVKAGEREKVTFTLRKATARERYGIPPRNRSATNS